DGAVAADLAALSLGFGSGDNEKAVTQKIALPVKGANGTTIVWTSSNAALFGNDGTIVRTNEADEPVTLAAWISKAGLRDQGREFQVVLAAAKAELDSAETEIGYASEDSATFVTQNLVLPLTGKRGSTVAWSSLSAKVLSDAGVLSLPMGQDEKVTLRATLVNGPSRATRDFAVVAKDYSVFADAASLALTFSSSDSENHVTAKLGLPAAGANKTTITWNADQPDLVASNGDVKRPEGRDVKVTLKAVVTKADRSTEKTFTVNVIDVTMFRITTGIAKQIADKKLQNVTVMETPQGISITAGGLAFGADSGEINKDVAAKLDLIGLILQNLDKNGDLRNAKIVIEGHSAVGSSGKPDNSDSPKSDMTVSKLRAEGVMKYFTSRNYVSASVITFLGYGSTKPIAEAKDAKNRRVEIVIVKDNAAEEGSK
ncbi:MAG: OmpA family protein, partial [Spirochaetota bacterium]